VLLLWIIGWIISQRNSFNQIYRTIDVLGNTVCCTKVIATTHENEVDLVVKINSGIVYRINTYSTADGCCIAVR